MLDRRGVLRAASLAVLAGSMLAASRVDGGGVVPGRGVAPEVCTSRGPADEAAVPGAVRAMWAFGSGLWERLAGEPGNLGLSPFSVAVALGMTANGAAGRTHREMLSVLGAASDDEINEGLNALAREVERLADPKVVLATANQIFGQQDIAWEQEFQDVLAREYCASVRPVDFVGATEAARVAVNDWASERTHGRIEEILPAGAVSDLTRLVLVNALSFKADWRDVFEKSLTADEDFHLADGSTVQVPTMHGMQWGAAYVAGHGWEAVRVPYVGGKLATTVVLPDRGQDVDVAALPEMFARARPETVDLALPRWTFLSSSPLKGPLAELGMRSAFDTQRADLTRMTDTDELLWIDEVHHQVFVAVDEEGTEAAAVTAVSGDGAASAPEYRTVVVDRPFLFVIHDIEYGTPFFLGRVDDPRG